MLTLAQFAPLVGDAFELRDAADAPHPAALVEAKALHGAPFNGREPFALLFEGPAEPVLPQRIYGVRHPHMQAQEMFLVPVGRTPTGVRYEAVFN